MFEKLPSKEKILIKYCIYRSVRDGTYISASSAALRLNLDISEAEAALDELEKGGFIQRKPDVKSPETLFKSLDAAVSERERLLHLYKLRKTCLLDQEKFSLADLIIGIGEAPAIRNSRIVGPHIAEDTTIPLGELKVTLFRFSEDDILSELQTLETQGLLIKSRHLAANDHGVKLTIRGMHNYKKDVMPRLKLGANEAITDLVEKSKIEIFLAWQSEDKNARNQIKSSLDSLVETANREWKPIRDLIVTQATEHGDGAVNISIQLKKKIEESTIFIGDVTPVLKNSKRLYPNSNVLIETGFAMGKKESESQIVLLEAERSEEEIKGESEAGARFPFDIDQIRRIKFKTPAELKQRLALEIKKTLDELGLLLK